MSDPTLLLQGWIVTTLSGSPGAGAQVFDKVPQTNPFPRITIGPVQCLPDVDDGQCGATFEVFQQIDIWSRTAGYPEVKTIGEAVKGLLHNAAVTLNGFNVVLLQWVSTEYLRDPDGLTNRARMQFRALIDQA